MEWLNELFAVQEKLVVEVYESYATDGVVFVIGVEESHKQPEPSWGEERCHGDQCGGRESPGV